MPQKKKDEVEEIPLDVEEEAMLVSAWAVVGDEINGGESGEETGG